ncbi:ferritin-like protein [Nocardiopsis aegyptia]|uniref:ferritin-like domain-containing protein n=1 Tax=Nocardiopsis aegyptia TaxID=220378 RepID=UPI00366C34E0
MSVAGEVHAAGFGVPDTMEKLRTYLQAALEVEHLTIPVYMTGMYTIRPGTNSTAHYVIRSVLLEEMLHMTLAANLLNAVGGHPKVAHPDFIGKYPARLPMSSDKLKEIHLRHFSPKALDTFLAIEQPRSFSTKVPEGSGWTSIGQFYETVRQGLVRLVREHGESKVFTGPDSSQVGPEDFYNSGGEAFKITDLKTALTAIEVISEQGEGAHGSIWDSDDQLFGEERQLAHYFRFKEIREGRRYSPNDVPDLPPSGPLLDVTWDDVYKIDGDAKLADYKKHAATSEVYARAKEFNDVYAMLLGFLDLAFNGFPPAMLAAVPTMLEMRDRAERLFRNPHPDPAQAGENVFASATFEITTPQFAQAKERVQQYVAAADLDPGTPVSLSGTTVTPTERPA